MPQDIRLQVLLSLLQGQQGTPGCMEHKPLPVMTVHKLHLSIKNAHA